MNDEQLKELYQGNPKYSKELDPKEPDYRRLLIETLEWKIPHLMAVVPPFYKPKKVAEIGCFCGHLIGNITINGINDFIRLGYEINSKAVKVGQGLYPEVFFSEENIFESHPQLDLIILSDIVEHIEDDLNFLQQCSAISNFVLLNLPLEKAYLHRNRKYGYKDPSGHLRAYNLSKAFNLISSSNFSMMNWHTQCVVKDPVYSKLKLLRCRESNKKNTFKTQLKKRVLLSLSQIPGFAERYYGTNLFAFLKSNSLKKDDNYSEQSLNHPSYYSFTAQRHDL